MGLPYTRHLATRNMEQNDTMGQEQNNNPQPEQDDTPLAEQKSTSQPERDNTMRQERQHIPDGPPISIFLAASDSSHGPTFIGNLKNRKWVHFTRIQVPRSGSFYLNSAITLSAANHVYGWMMSSKAYDDQLEPGYFDFHDLVSIHHMCYVMRIPRLRRGSKIRDEIVNWLDGPALAFDEFAHVVECLGFDDDLVADACNGIKKRWEEFETRWEQNDRRFSASGVPEIEAILKYVRDGVEGLPYPAKGHLDEFLEFFAKYEI